MFALGSGAGGQDGGVASLGVVYVKRYAYEIPEIGGRTYCSVDSLARAVTWACDGLPGENNLSFFRILSSKFLAHSKKL